MKNGQQIETYVLIRHSRESGVELLYERYGKKLYSYALTSWKVDEDTAWELVYETLYKMVSKIDEYEFETEKKFGSFLFTIFCNNLRRHYRDTRKREERLSFENFNESLFDESRGSASLGTERRVQDRITEMSIKEFSEGTAKNSELMELLEDCLEKLQDWERILLLLRSQDMPYSEIAKYMHKPADQLKVYHQRARKKLKQMMNERMNAIKQELS